VARTTNLPLQKGVRLNRYRIHRRLAAGGFGVVYLGERDDGRKVAIKEFLPSVIACRKDGERVTLANKVLSDRFRSGLQAFFREADMLSRIHDDRVIAIWDVFEANGTAYFAMPFEKGHTVQALVKRRGWVSDATARRLFVEASHGVEVLHRCNLLHLDLKPDNLWVRPDGSVVVLDLGASRWSDEEGLTLRLARTPGFAAPEQHRGRKAVLDVRTDVYGLAAALRALLEGQSPPTAPQRMKQPGEGMGRRWRGQRDAQLLAVVDRGMALNPADRWPTVEAWRKALEALPRLSPTAPRREDLDSPSDP
jgi:serine/threonine protein kinase